LALFSEALEAMMIPYDLFESKGGPGSNATTLAKSEFWRENIQITAFCIKLNVDMENMYFHYSVLYFSKEFW
jgi:hypothetical protein